MSGDRHEYRLSWRREGRGRKTQLFQTKRGVDRRALLIAGRLDEYLGKSTDALACCDGSHYCGCGGKTVGQEMADRTANLPPLVEGPSIEVRPVGEWEAVTADVG